MEISVILGLIISGICVIISIVLSGDIGTFWNVPSVFIVIGGVIGATIATYPLSDLKTVPTLLKIAFTRTTMDMEKDIGEILGLAVLARREGLLALEKSMDGMDNEFLKNGIMMILDGSDSQLVQELMETEVHFMQSRHGVGAGMFYKMSAYSPAFGMIGTLIGLINMLRTLSEMDSLGINMAIALVTTFYGVVLANVLFIPIATQLERKSELEALRNNMIIEGVLSIQNGEHPTMIEDKLLAFVSRQEAAEIRAKRAAIKPKS